MSTNNTLLWQDRKILFDIRGSQLQLRQGEDIIDQADGIEDRKGVGEQQGTLIVTNLRILWVGKKRYNLSIGNGCVTGVTTMIATSKINGNLHSLFVSARYQMSRFEFSFCAKEENSRVFSMAALVHDAYMNTMVYRDVKLRGIFIHNKELILLPEEQVIKKVIGVWNLSSQQGNLGTFFVTNIRLVWHGDLNETFNISIPYIQMKNVRVRESKFGTTLIVETLSESKGFVLGFRIDPPDQLLTVAKEIRKVFEIFSKSPIFGIQYFVDSAIAKKKLQLRRPSITSTFEFTADEDCDNSESAGIASSSSSYLRASDLTADSAEGSLSGVRSPWQSLEAKTQYCEEIGLAIERIPDNTSLQSLWKGFL